jgi:hypothetical protein
MENKVEIEITVRVREAGAYSYTGNADGRAEATYTLPDHHNLPHPDIAILITTAYDEYKAKQAAAEAKEAEEGG